MRRRLPPLNALMAFDAAARHGNFTRAARELGVAQPAVTRHIHNLEAWLGVSLFQRTGNAVELSPDGYAIADLVTPMFDRLELGLGKFSDARRNEIVIGASFGMMHMWLMPQITAMRGAARGSTINFVTSENYADFENSGIHLSIRFGSGDWPGKHADLLFYETTHVIVSPDFLRKNPVLNRQDLCEVLKPEWLLDHGDPYHYGWMTWRRWFKHHGHELPNLVGVRNIQNYPTVLDMVKCSEGVALGFVGLDDELVDAGEIVRIGQPVHRPNLGYYLLSDANRDHIAAVEELRHYLAALV